MDEHKLKFGNCPQIVHDRTLTLTGDEPSLTGKQALPDDNQLE